MTLTYTIGFIRRFLMSGSGPGLRNVVPDPGLLLHQVPIKSAMVSDFYGTTLVLATNNPNGFLKGGVND